MLAKLISAIVAGVINSIRCYKLTSISDVKVTDFHYCRKSSWIQLVA